MDDRAICIPWDKNFALTPLGQTVVYGELQKFLQENMKIYPSMSIPPGTDTKRGVPILILME